MRSGTVTKIHGSTVRVIEATCDFSQFKRTYELFDSPVKDMVEVEWWEDQVRMLGFDYCILQIEKHYVSGKIKVLGYNIITDKPVAKEGTYGA